MLCIVTVIGVNLYVLYCDSDTFTFCIVIMVCVHVFIVTVSCVHVFIVTVIMCTCFVL
jgi:hypothetical protein